MRHPTVPESGVVVVGAGISGLTFARAYAEKNKKTEVLVVEKRGHIGGNCFDAYDEAGLLVQKYGPHIFHTNDEKVWDFLSRFTEWTDYKHKVLAKHRGEYYPVPINRNTINKFFKTELKTEQGVLDFLEKKRVSLPEIRNSEDVVVSRFGAELYEAFVKHYTKKQWGVYPDKLPPSVLQRLPIRYDDNDYYYNAAYQGMPKEGFTRMFEAMADHPNIKVALNQDFLDMKGDVRPETTVVYTGRIDELFGKRYGQLPYLYTDFEHKTFGAESYQPNSVINHSDEETLYIRTAEYKKLTGQKGKSTSVCFEYMRLSGIPTHPVPGGKNAGLYERYRKLAPKNYHFLGRLGRHSYLDIDAACRQALKLAEELK